MFRVRCWDFQTRITGDIQRMVLNFGKVEFSVSKEHPLSLSGSCLFEGKI